MVRCVVNGDGGEEGSGIKGGHDLMGAEFNFFSTFHKVKRIFADIGVGLNKGLEEIVKVSC